MLELTRENIRIITETVDKAEITFSHLRDDLIDHICCEIESIMQQGTNFQTAFARIKKSFGIKDLQKVQEQTLLLIDKKYCIMKKMMKVSGVISTALLMFGSLFKINHWPFAGILLVTGFLTLCCFFLPSANYVMHKENKDRRRIFLYISAFFGSSGFFLGLLFKIMHWPGANILLLVGLGLLGFVFLPTLLVFLLRTSKNKSERIIYSIGVIAGIIYLFGFLFKLMRWPGASAMLALGAVVLVAVFVPVLTVVRYKQEQYMKGSFIYLIAAISWFILFSALISINISTSPMKSIVRDNLSIQHAVQVIEDQNDLLIKASENTAEYQLNLVVDSISDNLYNYIEDLKIEIVNAMNEENDIAVGTGIRLDITTIKDYSNQSVPYSVMISDNHQGKAYELKRKIEATREEFISKVKNDEETSPVIISLLNTSIPKENAEWAGSWEIAYFNRTSVIGSMNVLSSLQRNVRLAEMETICSIIYHSSNQ